MMAMMKLALAAGAACMLSTTLQAQQVDLVVPNGFELVGGSNNNAWPFSNTLTSQRYQQVYRSTDFGLLGGPHELVEIRFRPNQTSTFTPWENTFTLDLRFSTTQAAPDQLSLTFDDNVGPDETVVYSGQATISTQQSGPSGGPPLLFDVVITLQTPFVYNPAEGNLLMDVRRIGFTVAGSRPLDAQTTAGDAVSRIWASDSTATLAIGSSSLGLITQFFFEPAGPVCYANCDSSTTAPILNVDDFTCFINEFASAQSLPHEQQVTHYANCDGSTTAPALNVDDFTCFINAFATGCP